MTKFLIKSVAFIFIVSFMSCGNKENKETTKQQKDPITVETATVKASNSSLISTSGQIKALDQATMSTRMMGYIEEVPVEVGQKIKKGDPLIHINSQEINAKKAQVAAEINKTKANFKNAKRDYERYQNLLEKNSISQKEFDNIEMAFDMAKANQEAAQQMIAEVESQFAYTNLRAAFDGIVTNIYAEVGNLAQPGEPLLRIENLSKFEIHTTVSESQISNIKIGDSVAVSISSLGLQTTAKVSEVAGSASQTNGQYKVKAVLDQSPDAAKSGMYASINFKVKNEKTAATQLMIEKEAIISKGELQGVYTISSSNTAILNWLRLGKTHDDMIEVISGISADDTYILQADSRLYNGAPIRLK
ncbi:MAG: efflux RND transporter periplasmic adaptor subunit [Psychroflexus sp.]|nr:efflux RND transporter periplasmic adaptor subunit [Psychroflexus sp.]